ncbi:hypothetical protein CYLTODRAFT_208662 [Cylindrobasidium torrendii FP15055 ss-10]|uniref:Uncharacterized protein n=1 Tax=Cylindrobasidium torrendii FP15055 ss-10 TaxID=1314674 RepID=A0A0D7BHG6_9AGAR|nr:hypothetical protein CYLTODRAFT_208662 [Cylindrobasidium torrendii FP15055 ss-10]
MQRIQLLSPLNYCPMPLYIESHVHLVQRTTYAPSLLRDTSYQTLYLPHAKNTLQSPILEIGFRYGWPVSRSPQLLVYSSVILLPLSFKFCFRFVPYYILFGLIRTFSVLSLLSQCMLFSRWAAPVCYSNTAGSSAASVAATISSRLDQARC